MIAKLFLEAGKRIALADLADRLSSLYVKLKHEPKRFSDQIEGYEIRKPDGTTYTLQGMASRNGLENELRNYSKPMLQNMLQYLSELKTLVDYLKNADATKPNSGINLYAAARDAREKMLKLVGYDPAAIRRHGYVSDVAHQYLHDIGDLNSEVERLLGIASGFDSRGKGIVYTGFRKALKFVVRQALEKRGVPFTTLENILSSQTRPFADLRKQGKPLFVEYRDLVKSTRANYADTESGVYAAAA